MVTDGRLPFAEKKDESRQKIMYNYIINKKNVQKVNNYFNSVKGSRNIPYGFGSKVITWFCKTRFAREEYFTKRLNIFRQFLKSLPGEYNEEELLPRNIYSNFLKGWRSSSISWMSEKKLPRYVTINGLEHLEKALKEGKGVIMLNSHFGLAQAALYIFPILGYQEFYTVVRAKGLESLKFEGSNKKNSPKILAFKNNSQGELFKQMYRAKEVLNKGGIVHLLGDGYHGMSAVNISFLGKLRGFRPSYAELSIASGAIVLPTFVDCAMKGKITVDILQALDAGNKDMKADDVREHMTKQYAKLLEDRWIEQPWNVHWKFIEKHLYQVDAED